MEIAYFWAKGVVNALVFGHGPLSIPTTGAFQEVERYCVESVAVALAVAEACAALDNGLFSCNILGILAGDHIWSLFSCFGNFPGSMNIFMVHIKAGQGLEKVFGRLFALNYCFFATPYKSVGSCEGRLGVLGRYYALISWDNPMAPSLRQQPLITGLVLAVGWVCCT